MLWLFLFVWHKYSALLLCTMHIIRISNAITYIFVFCYNRYIFFRN